MPGGRGFYVTPNQQLGRRLSELKDGLTSELEAFAGDVVLEARWRVARRTPVLHGVARGNWRVGLNGVDERFSPADADPTGANGNAEAIEILRNLRLGMTVFVSNLTPYIGSLNRGSSRKAPSGFIEMTVAEIPFIAEQLAAGLRGRMHGTGPKIGRRPGESGSSGMT